MDPQREEPTVGVAQHADVGASTRGCLEHAQPVVAVVVVAVEEVLEVDEDPTSLAHEVLDGVAHHGEVLVQRGSERLGDMPDVGLGNQRDDGGLGVQQGLHLGVLADGEARSPRGAEGHQLGTRQVQLGSRPGEELGVLRQCAGPSTLDEANSEIVEQPSDRQLVGHRVRDALALGTVTQRRVVDVEGVVRTHRTRVAHGGRSPEFDKKVTPRTGERSAHRRAGALGDNEGGRHSPSVTHRAGAGLTADQRLLTRQSVAESGATWTTPDTAPSTVLPLAGSPWGSEPVP